MVEDAVKVEPNLYKVLLENDRVRVLESRYRPGEKSAMHSHPDVAAYFLKDGKAQFTLPDGQSFEMDANAGEAAFVEAQDHIVENVGSTDIHVVLFELK